MKDEPDWGLYNELILQNRDKTNKKPGDYETIYRSQINDNVNYYQHSNVADQLRAFWSEPKVDVKPKLEYIEIDPCQQSLERLDEEFVKERNAYELRENLVESNNATGSIEFDISGTQAHEAHDQLTENLEKCERNIDKYIMSNQSDDSNVCFSNDESVVPFIGDKKQMIKKYKQGTTDACSSMLKINSPIAYKGFQDDHKQFECDYCHNLFRLKANLGAHMKIHNKEVFTDTKPFDGKANKDKLRQRRNHHLKHTIPKEYLKRLQYEQAMVQCNFCSEKIQRRNLKRHKKIHKREKIKIKCHICNKLFLGKKSLQLHMMTHMDDFKREKFECSICKKQFLQSHGLAYHMDTHRTRKMVQCSICLKKFLNECGLKSHMITHADKTTRERIKCELCNKTFLQSNGLAYHMEIAHKIIRGRTDGRTD